MSKTAYGSVLKVVAMAMFVASTCRGWVCTASLPEGATRVRPHLSRSTTRLTPWHRKPRFRHGDPHQAGPLRWTALSAE